MKPIINFIFSIGYRCYSTKFLINFKLRKMSSPFDYLFIDFETALKNINNNFDDYLNDIILLNKNTQQIELFYKKNTIEINNKFYELLKNNIGYMAHNYNNVNLLFNQNYLENDNNNNNNNNDNLYNWETICSFYHHNILDTNIYTSIKNRCERFNTIMNIYNKTTALFYITKIITIKDIESYMNNIIKLKIKYNINCFIIIIINSDNFEDNYYYNEIEKCLFIIKKVENYETQYSKYQTDNNLNYEKEFDIISNIFSFNLIEKTQIL
jgi:hypothetical protein